VLGLQARSAISNQQKHQQVQAALQDALATKKEEARQLQQEKTAVLAQVDQLEQQIKEGQVSLLLVHCLPCLLCLLDLVSLLELLCLLCMLLLLCLVVLLLCLMVPPVYQLCMLCRYVMPAVHAVLCLAQHAVMG